MLRARWASNYCTIPGLIKIMGLGIIQRIVYKHINFDNNKTRQDKIMTHADKGHYANKHQNKKVDEKITSLIKSLSKDNNLTCAMAHKAAKELGVSPGEIGIQTDLLEYRITMCQIGLFGYDGGTKKIDPDFNIPSDMGEQIDKINDDGRLSCLDCWNIAKDLKAKKIDVASACDKKEIRIKPCQLGAF